MLITSHTAKVFDGIVYARMRAVAESNLPENEFGEECHRAHRDPEGNRGSRPADALWVHAPSGTVTPLCKECVDFWLDNGDESGDDDPPALIPLRGRRRRA